MNLRHKIFKPEVKVLNRPVDILNTTRDKIYENLQNISGFNTVFPWKLPG